MTRLGETSGYESKCRGILITNSAYMISTAFNKIALAFSTAERAEMITTFAHPALPGVSPF